MPNRVKAPLSILVLLVAAAGARFLASLGETRPTYAALFLGVISVAAMWIFPEVKRVKPN